MNTPDTIHFTKEANDKRSAAYANAVRVEKLAALDRLIASVEAGTLTEHQTLQNGEILPMCSSTWDAYCGSFDAAMNVKDEILPGWMVQIIQTYGGSWMVNAKQKSSQQVIDSVFAATPARALLLATLKAYRHTVAEGRE